MKFDASKKGAGLLVTASRVSTLNADPRTCQPRMDTENIAWCSSAKIKRLVRDIYADPARLDRQEIMTECGIKPDAKGYDIIEQPDVRNNMDEVRRISEDAHKDLNKSEFLNRFYDGRLFGGALLPEKKDVKGKKEINEDGKECEKKNITTTFLGPIQVEWGHSLDPVELMLEGPQSITRKCASRGGTSRSMANDAVTRIKFALFIHPFFYSATAGRKMKVTDKDLEMFVKSLPYIGNFKSDANPCTEVVACWYFQHKTEKGLVRDADVQDILTPKKKKGCVVPLSYKDYIFPTVLPSKITSLLDSYENFALPVMVDDDLNQQT